MRINCSTHSHEDICSSILTLQCNLLKPASVPEPEQESSNNPEAEEEVADPAEDLQIAWENLDIARTILSRLVEPFDRTNIDSTVITLKSDNTDTTHSYTKEEQQELLLDLAQIHTRLGDVQRANGNSSSVEDYSRSLEIRRHVLGEYDKLVADNHYYLAQAYGEAPSKEKEREDGALGIVAALGGGGEGEGGTCDGMTKEEIAECLVKSMDHYLACGISFAGYLANMCGEDPEKTTEAKTEGATAAAASLNCGGGGTHSQILETIRKRIANLKPISDTDTDKVNDTKEILDEIQEALDTAEGSEDALKAVHAMKESEIRKHSGNGEEEVVGKNGATTTIGFGTVGATAAAAASTASIGFGTCKTDVASAPMMVVKKKKKSSTNDGGTAMKRAKSE